MVYTDSGCLLSLTAIGAGIDFIHIFRTVANCGPNTPTTVTVTTRRHRHIDGCSWADTLLKECPPTHRFPKEIISYCVWFYFRFAVSFRDVEEALASRGVLVSYETIRRWCDKFGYDYAAGLRRRRARTGDKWHLDEVFLNINGVKHYL
jgi:hypothetical protein